jgi:hypothetical protein
MTAAIIGISLALLIIFIFSIFKDFDKKIIYGFILTGIGFLYIGFAWTDFRAVVINSIQAALFFFMAYYGIKKNIYILISGYFLHGIWDIGYHLFQNSNLIPPHYDLFCFANDFTFGFYLLLLVYRNKNLFRA